MNAQQQHERRVLQQKRGDKFCVLCASPEPKEGDPPQRKRKPCCPACGGSWSKLLKVRRQIGVAEHDRRARVIAQAKMDAIRSAVQARLPADEKLDIVAQKLDQLDAERGPVLVDNEGRPL